MTKKTPLARTLAGLGASALMASTLAVGFGVSAQPAAADRACSGTLSKTVVNDDLYVPAGKSCTLNYVTVKGDVKVARGATLQTAGGRVTGNIQAERQRLIRMTATTVGGDLQVKYGGTVTTARVTLGGDAQFTEMSGTASMSWGRIGGNYQAEKSPAKRVLIRAARVDGDIQVKEYGIAAVGRNTVGGNVQIEKNRSSLYVEGNRIDGALQCKENRYVPKGGNNIASSKEGQCRRL
ncbi:hypothetical protein [Micrococcus terreus]|uniref:Polymer-forming protein n=1 Tax=Micrococcus terreus TaxID=574650 RepID=A0A1I7ME73_9MICC|nr:hypothetical protein [Micrococcus terreus]SFV20235.1 hypothetical protein SAMN04487966_101252 [Micrococcus terreus]